MIVIGCIACGGFLEVVMVIVGLRFIYSWLKKKHNRKHCNCCKGQDEQRFRENQASE